MTRRDAVRIFFSYASPRILAGLLLAAGAVRLALGGFGLADALAAAAVVAWWPVQEWLLHRTLLHLRPIALLGRRVDFEFARRHRAHHREPERLDLVVLPVWVHVVSVAVLAALVAALPSTRVGWTVVVAAVVMALQYEWIHFAVHAPFRTASPRLRRVRRHHMLHHLKSERFWFGFSAVTVDRLLGTAPDPREVPTSPTCRTLGIGAEDDSEVAPCGA